MDITISSFKRSYVRKFDYNKCSMPAEFCSFVYIQLLVF